MNNVKAVMSGIEAETTPKPSPLQQVRLGGKEVGENPTKSY
jgi:hypothetical protein